MANKNILLKTVIIVAVFGLFWLPVLGAVYSILSPREVAIGWFAWFAALLLVAIVRKLTAKKNPTSNAAPEIVIDDRTRTRLLRGIRMNKIWIGILAVCLPVGIGKGVKEGFSWLWILVAVGISPSLMYVEMREIRRKRKLLESDPGMTLSSSA